MTQFSICLCSFIYFEFYTVENVWLQEEKKKSNLYSFVFCFVFASDL